MTISADDPSGVSRINCPTCGEAMRVVFKHGVSADICPEHGIWLDNGELDRIICRIRERAGGQAKTHAQKERARGALLGPGMVFLDRFLMGD